MTKKWEMWALISSEGELLGVEDTRPLPVPGNRAVRVVITELKRPTKRKTAKKK